MDERPPTTITHAVPRSARQPTRTRTTGLILLAFVLVVWFIAPGQLPLFFQRLVGIVCALLAMLLVVFAIREYGKKYNRLRWPLLGRVSTSKVLGTLTFLAVLALWLSPWAPIQPIESEPDLWRLLEQGLDAPLLMLVDHERAMIAPPAPSESARQLASAITPDSPPFAQALKAVAESRFSDADGFFDRLEREEHTNPESLELVRAARSQADVYAGRCDKSSGRYRELLGGQPRREDYLAHAALAAALAGDYETATARAQQLRDQAGTRRRDAARYRQAVNLLVAINAAQGRYGEAQRLGEETKTRRERGVRAESLRDEIEPQLIADINNQTVIGVFTATANADSGAGFESARRLVAAWNDANSWPADSASVLVAVPAHNLGVAELIKGNLTRANQALTDALAIERRLGEGPIKRMVESTSEALAKAETKR
jgi:tetratricopeptide (TPR) repeat protein